jgi:N-acyl amino acid synthase of PEP-CTERM/exosortase system
LSCRHDGNFRKHRFYGAIFCRYGWNAPESSAESLLERFNLYFETMHADTPALLQQAHALRFRVYCLEMGTEDAAAFPDGLERDAFDTHSVHSLLIHRPSQAAMGTVRLVLPVAGARETSFAVQGLSDHPALRDGTAFPLHSTAEVSRFCISNAFRRRASDTLYDGADEPANSADRRSGPLMRLGLIQALVGMSIRYGITHWCAVMEPTLLRMLDAMAIRFSPIGPPVEHHGLRQPCSCDIAEALAAVKREHPSYWDILTRAGTVTF